MNKFTKAMLDSLRMSFQRLETLDDDGLSEMDLLLARCSDGQLVQLATAKIPHLSAAAETRRQLRWSNFPKAQQL